MIYKKLNKPELILALSTACLIFLFYLFFNLNYLSQWIDEKGDAITYDYYVRLGIPLDNQQVKIDSYNYLFNPHHILFDWLGQRLYILLLKAGYEHSSMLVLQLRNLFISALGLAILFFLFYKISKKWLLSFLLICSIAFSCAYWIYSQINDTPIIHSVMLCILFLTALYFPQAKRKILFACFIGALHALTIFFHQSDLLMMIILFFIFIFSIYFTRQNDNDSPQFGFYEKRKNVLLKNLSLNAAHFKYFACYLTVFSIIVILAYYYVGIVLIGLTIDPDQAKSFNNIKESSYFFNWLILYTKIDYWGKGLERTDTLKLMLTGIATYFYQPVSFDGQTMSAGLKNFFSPLSILPNLIVTLFIFTFGSLIIFIKRLWQKYHFVLLANLLFMLIYTVFSCWWEPDYREFWVATLFSFWILAFLILNFYLDWMKRLQPLVQIVIYSFLFLLAFLLFYFNFSYFLYPHASSQFRHFEIFNQINQIKPGQ